MTWRGLQLWWIRVQDRRRLIKAAPAMRDAIEAVVAAVGDGPGSYHPLIRQLADSLPERPPL